MYINLMLKYASQQKQAAWYNPATWFQKPKQDPLQNSMPQSQYANRMTAAQESAQRLGKTTMPKNFYANRMTQTQQEQGGMQNSMPQGFYTSRMPENVVRGQMGLSPLSERASAQLQQKLRETWDPREREDIRAQWALANTPGSHQQDYQELSNGDVYLPYSAQSRAWERMAEDERKRRMPEFEAMADAHNKNRRYDYRTGYDYARQAISPYDLSRNYGKGIMPTPAYGSL